MKQDRKLPGPTVVLDTSHQSPEEGTQNHEGTTCKIWLHFHVFTMVQEYLRIIN